MQRNRTRCSFQRLLVFFAIAMSSIAAQTPTIASLVRSAEAGDARAQFDLANSYFLGNGVHKDFGKGLEWLRKSVAQGYAGAEVTLGLLYQNGVGVAKDPHEAAMLFRKAARQAAKDPVHAQRAQSDLASLASEGLISVNESDWHAPEHGSETIKETKPKNNNKSQPFSLSEVETGLNGGITPKRMATLIGQYGVDFSLNASAKQRLNNDGADDALLQTIASSRR